MRFLLSDYEIERAILDYIKKESETRGEIIYSEMYLTKAIKKGEQIGGYSDAEMEVFVEFKPKGKK